MTERMPIRLTLLFRAWMAVACLMLSGCGGEPGTEDFDGPIDASEGPIINGTPVTTNGGSVAIYHYYTRPATCSPQSADAPFTQEYTLDDSWWPRPCTGKVIRVLPTNPKTYYILTARHCITLDGSIAGPLPVSGIEWGQRQVTMGLAPGVLSTVQSNGSMQVTSVPPASFPNASVWVAGHPATPGNTDNAEDYAIIVTSTNSFAVASGRTALYMGPASAMVGMSMKTQGYGRYVPGHCYNHATSGAGVLRSAQGHQVLSGTTDKLLVHQNSLGGVVQAGGDSGSSWLHQASDELLGVTSTPASGPAGPNLAKVLQNVFGYLYLVPNSQFRGARRLFGASGGVGSSLRVDFNEDSAKTRVKYDWPTKRIILNGLCVTHEWATPETHQVRLRACASSGTSLYGHQQWDLTWTAGVLKLTQASGTRCLFKSGTTGVNAKSCTGASTEAWKFITDDEPLAAGL